MGNYDQSIQLDPLAPDITATEKNGRTKYCFGVSWEQEINKELGVFLRASWNDGNNETWVFTEIDRSIRFGMSLDGNRWNRKNDIIGLASVTAGLSSPHRNYLHTGGYGFELGDGNLNYSLENLIEIYYSMELKKNLSVSGAYQLICNPVYNKDRGSANEFSVRLHLTI
jgi:high affinity Mn2+ porin